ncbi:hypothetical protein Bbelb_268420 [Branchiostoma belcheri]|nr:hypothetical protein Bbelb_268420 [Branchiostoma belcheri]
MDRSFRTLTTTESGVVFIVTLPPQMSGRSHENKWGYGDCQGHRKKVPPTLTPAPLPPNGGKPKTQLCNRAAANVNSWRNTLNRKAPNPGYRVGAGFGAKYFPSSETILVTDEYGI